MVGKGLAVAALALLLLKASTQAQDTESTATTASSTAAFHDGTHSDDHEVSQQGTDPASSALKLSEPSSFAQGLPTRSVSYVALGDSYSAGNGAHRLSGESCRQAVLYSWPQQISELLQKAGSLAPNEAWASAACSGYTSVQMGKGTEPYSWLSNATKYVTLTAGGNDIGFASTLKTCVNIDKAKCIAAAGVAGNKIKNLGGALQALYEDVARAAPNAAIYVAGYPDIVPYTTTLQCYNGGILSQEELDSLRALVNPLNEQIMTAVDKVNKIGWVRSRLTYVDVRPDFYKHEPCSEFFGRREYVNAIKLDLEASFHPNLYGQDAYASQVWSCMKDKHQCSNVSTATF